MPDENALFLLMISPGVGYGIVWWRLEAVFCPIDLCFEYRDRWYMIDVLESAECAWLDR